MTDYISRSAAINAICNAGCPCKGVGDCVNKDCVVYNIMEVPAADVAEVIRCRDCKYNQMGRNAGNANCTLWYGMADQNGFCHCGERR